MTCQAIFFKQTANILSELYHFSDHFHNVCNRHKYVRAFKKKLIFGDCDSKQATQSYSC